MRKIKTILIALSFALCSNMAMFNIVHAGTYADIVYEQMPLFKEANIIPGDSVTRFVRVTNKITGAMSVNATVANASDPDGLGSMLNIVIKRGETALYNNTLSAFFASGASLGSLNAGDTAQYDFTVRFYTSAGNPYQEKTLSFNITVTAQGDGEEGGSEGYGLSYSSFSGGRAPYKNDDPTVLGIEGYSDLAIEKTCGLEMAAPGQTGVPFRITVVNNGTMAASDVVLNDALPEGFVFSGTDETFKSWPAVDISSGEIKTYEYTIDILGTAEEKTYTNVATIVKGAEVQAEDSADLKIMAPSVLGMEFFSTGFSVKEFLLLVLLLTSLVFCSAMIRKNLNKG